MDSLSPVTLGTIFSAAVTAAFALRLFLLPRILKAESTDLGTKYQFGLELSLFLAVGVSVMLYNRVVFSFPIVKSGLKVVLGCALAGFFIAVDLALHREREIIRAELIRNAAHPPPKRLYSLTTRFSLVSLVTTVLISIVLILVFIRDLIWLSQIGINPTSLKLAFRSVMIEVSFIMGVIFIWIANMVLSYSKNLNLLFETETEVLERVSIGDFSKSVPVATNDEFGVIAGYTNLMINGLKHRIRLLSALKIAEETQKSLLPRTPPAFPNLDISGVSIYCDETGGDYYDFFKLSESRIGIVVADASGHGIGSALQMTTARGFLVSGAQNYRSPLELLDRTNRFLIRDTAQTGQFVSLFFIEIDVAAQTLKWIRAGHEPALLYHPEKDGFVELSGKGVALGVTRDIVLEENESRGWLPDSVLVIATDGIKEARNATGEMFGIERLKEAIRLRARKSAQEILQAITDDMNEFTGDSPKEDDVTIVVVKLQ